MFSLRPVFEFEIVLFSQFRAFIYPCIASFSDSYGFYESYTYQFKLDFEQEHAN